MLPALPTPLAAAWRFVNGNLVASLAICGMLIGGYVGLTIHHYNRGWDARDRELAANVEALNATIATLNEKLSEAETHRVDDVRRAVTEVHAYWRDLSPAPAPVAPPVTGQACPPPAKAAVRHLCGLPDGVRLRLNTIR